MTIETLTIPLIVIDERERGEVRSLFAQYPCRPQIETLNVSDYILAPDWAVERKRGDDLVASICDGRLFTQITNLRKHFAHPLIILENPFKMFKRSGMNPASIYGALLYASYKLHVPVIPTHDAAETGLVHLVLSQASPAESTLYLCESESRQSTHRSPGSDLFLQGLDAVGEAKAAQLLDAFKTPQSVINAILNAEIRQNKSSKAIGITGPLGALKGIGVSFIQKNRRLLSSKSEK